MIKRLLLPFLLFTIFSYHTAKADHFIGSDFTWECLGKDTFKVILTFYQDCNGCHFGVRETGCTWELCGLPALNIATDKCGSQNTTFKQTSHKDITPVCTKQCSRCTKCDCDFKFGIRRHTLEAIVVVSNYRKNGCCELRISYRSCCRSTTITTGAANNGFYVDAVMNICQSPCDNSPIFTNAPVAILCVGRDFIYNQGALDKDVDTASGGLIDSLVYSFGSPMSSATTATPWSGGFDKDKPLTYLGFPKKNQRFPKGFLLDTFTGDMMFRPMKEEITVMTIKVEQYRNGKYISETRRDIQVIVVKCPNNDPPVISGIDCSKPTPSNFKADACANQNLCFRICTSDKNKNDTVTLAWNNGIPGATFKIDNKGGKRENGTFCWTPTDADVSKIPYYFVVTAKDNACPVNGFTARSFAITVKESPKISYDTLVYDCGNVRFTTHKTGRINIQQYIWNYAGRQKFRPGNVDRDTIIHKFNYAGKKPFSILVLGKNDCTNIYEDTVTIPEYVNVTTNRDTTVCAGETIQIAASIKDSIGNVEIEWSNGVKGKRAFDFTVGTKDTFLVAHIKDDECSNFDTIKIKVNNPPEKLELGNDPQICPGENFVFHPEMTFADGDEDTNLVFTWFRGNRNNLIQKADSFIANDSGLYYAVATDSLGCQTSDSVRLLVNPMRNWLPNNQVLCEGDSVKIEIDAELGNSQLLWYNSPVDTVIPIDSGIYFTDFITESKVYGIRWREKVNGLNCNQFDSVLVKINPLPEIKLSLPTQVCVDHGELNLITFADPIGGTWFDTSDTKSYVRGNRFYSNEAGVVDDKRTLHRVGYTFQDFSTKCVDTTYGVVIVKPLPKVELNIDTIILCNSENRRDLNQYVATPVGKGIWKGTGLVKEGTKNFFSLDIVGTNPAEYQLIYSYVDNNGTQPWCKNEDTLIVKVINVPEANAGVYKAVCIDAEVFDLDKESPKGNTGEWYYRGLDGTQWQTVTNEFDPETYAEGNHKFSYVFRVKGSECADTAQTSVDVNPLPVPNITNTWDKIDGENRICLVSDPVLLVGNTSDGISTYSLTSFSGTGVEEIGGTSFQFNPNLAGLGEFEITYDVENQFGCKANTEIIVVVDDIKKVSYDNDIVCLGDTILLNAEAENATQVTWSSDGQGSFLTSQPLSTTYLPYGSDLKGLFEITVTTDNTKNICPEVSFSVELQVHPLPNIRIEQSDSIACAPVEIIYTDSSDISRGEIDYIDWTFGNGMTARTTKNGATIPVTYSVTGSTDIYYGTAMAMSNEGCADSLKFRFTSLLTPVPAFVPKPGQTTIFRPGIEFENKSTYMKTDSNAYSWYFDDYNKDDGGISLDKDPYYVYSDTGVYQVGLRAVNAYNMGDVYIECIDTLIRPVILEPEILVFIPNAFSPNNDGPEANEVFKPVISNVSDYKVSVFNRWGERLWESVDLDEAWDGTFEGSDCQDDVYLYVIKVTNMEGRKYEFSGTITLLR